MELRQLKYFVAVAEDLHFGKAARRLNISQPPLSQQIMRLEEEMGAKLFNRTSRSVALTPEGVYFRDEAKAVLERIERAAETVSSMARGEEGALSIGFVVLVTQTVFSDVVMAFRKEWPKVRLDLRDMSTNEQLAALASGDIDVGFIRYYGHSLKGLARKVFLKESYVVAMPAQHRLADRSEVRLSELKGESLIMFNRAYHPGLFDTILELFSQAGVKSSMIQETHRHITAIALVAAGMGIAPMPASMRRLGREGVVYLPIADPFPTVEVLAVWPEGRCAPVLESFLDLLERFCFSPAH